tara:strand:+ start:8871 stop:9530 length:660 start_codon:yes stop_codon:yes gene_type:complete
MQIVVQKDDNKFINNLDSISGHTIAYTDFNNDIYKIHQNRQPDLYILVAEKLGYEEIHFCRNVSEVKIVVYHTTDQKTDIDDINTITHLYNKDIPILYNPYRFFNNNQDNRSIHASYFLDNDQDIPDDITKLIYPNSSEYTIKMFNNFKIDHPQNLGFLTEVDKNDILNDSEFYICKNNFYALEATLCGCKVLNTQLEEIQIDPKEHQTYSSYIESIIK